MNTDTPTGVTPLEPIPRTWPPAPAAASTAAAWAALNAFRAAVESSPGAPVEREAAPPQPPPEGDS